MNKLIKILIAVIAIILLFILIFYLKEKTDNPDVSKNTVVKIEDKDTAEILREDSPGINLVVKREIKPPDTVTEIENKDKTRKQNNTDWKIYVNEGIGFIFKYPSYWKKNSKEISIKNLNGKIKSVEIYFVDTITDSNLIVKYHPNPGGTVLYNYKLSQFEKSEGVYQSGKEEIDIDGYQAIEGISIRKIDGRGHKINPPIKLIIIDLLCDKLSGKLEFQFRTQTDNKASENVFRQLINTIEIMK